MLELVSFIAGSLLLAWVSRASLRFPRSHGFSRFIAWELMLVLVVLNMDGWYDAPLTSTQLVCGILMAASLFLFVASYLALLQFGKQDDMRSDAPLLKFEKTTALVTHGIYALIRHPMYSSLLLLDWGLFFKKISWFSGGIALLACVFLVLAALAEEKENLEYFGESYRNYMDRTRRFLPFLL